MAGNADAGLTQAPRHRSGWLWMVFLGAWALGGCAADKPKYSENFSGANTYSRTFPATDAASCDAARRALLSQGYTIGKAGTDSVDGMKNFQDDAQKHTQISFHVVCATDGKENKSTTVFVNAVQDHYIIKKTSSSAGVGLSVLGSVSMPFGSSDDSLAKIASETISSGDFYQGFFGLMATYLPKAEASDAAKAGDGAQARKDAGHAKADAAKADAAKADAAKADAAKADAAKADAAKADAAKPDASVAGAPKPDAPKPEAAKPDAPATGAGTGAGSSAGSNAGANAQNAPAAAPAAPADAAQGKPADAKPDTPLPATP
jgi:hypothetical protein